MSHADDEIRNQPHSWEETLAATPEQWRRIAQRLPLEPGAHALFVGAGTSFYLAQSAAHSFQEVTGYPSRAVPASEVFLSTASVVPGSVPVVAFVLSRSGTTSEVVMAARHLVHSFDHVRTVGITCTPGSELARETHHVVELPHAGERSVVMTQSFTNMLLAAQAIAAVVGGDDGLLAELAGLPDLLRARFDEVEAFATDLGARSDLRRFVYLGLGPNFGLAEEATLKLKEMTQVPVSAYNPLEFRHGPISAVTDDTAVVLLAGERERAYVADVEADVKRHGAYVATIAPYPSDYADATLRLPEGLSDLARCVLYLPPVQLLAHERAVRLGLDPDAPRNLSQVVTIDAR